MVPNTHPEIGRLVIVWWKSGISLLKGKEYSSLINHQRLPTFRIAKHCGIKMSARAISPLPFERKYRCFQRNIVNLCQPMPFFVKYRQILRFLNIFYEINFRLGQIRLGQVRLGQVRLGQVSLAQIWLVSFGFFCRQFIQNQLLFGAK